MKGQKYNKNVTCELQRLAEGRGSRNTIAHSDFFLTKKHRKNSKEAVTTDDCKAACDFGSAPYFREC